MTSNNAADRRRNRTIGDRSAGKRRLRVSYRLGQFAVTQALLLGIVALSASQAFAQEDDFHRNNITVGVGAATPVGNSTNYLVTAPLVNIAYGYRFNRLFQADAGFQMAFGAANNQNAEVTDFGNLQGGDHEFMIPLGGRIYIPLGFKRIELSAGGGAIYLHYSETVSSNGGYYSPGCYSCTSRGGWGGYGLANASYFLDSNHNFTVGTTIQYIAGATNGLSVGNVPANRTTDHWMNVMLDFGVSF